MGEDTTGDETETVTDETDTEIDDQIDDNVDDEVEEQDDVQVDGDANVVCDSSPDLMRDQVAGRSILCGFDHDEGIVRGVA